MAFKKDNISYILRDIVLRQNNNFDDNKINHSTSLQSYEYKLVCQSP